MKHYLPLVNDDPKEELIYIAIEDISQMCGENEKTIIYVNGSNAQRVRINCSELVKKLTELGMIRLVKLP